MHPKFWRHLKTEISFPRHPVNPRRSRKVFHDALLRVVTEAGQRRRAAK